MQNLLSFREKANAFIEKYNLFLRIVMKLVASFVMLCAIDHLFVTVNILGRISVKLAIAAVCAFVPMAYAFPVFGLICWLCFMNISRDVAMLILAVSLLLYLIYKRNFSKYGYVGILTVVFMQTPLIVAIPIFVGMIAGPMGIPPMILGIIIYYYGITVNEVMTEVAKSVGSYQLYQLAMDNMITNKELLLCLVCFLITLLITWRLYHAKISYAWQIAIPIAGVAYMIIHLYGSFLLGTSDSVVHVSIYFLLSVIVLEIIQFFHGILDYSRAENLEFEDDEYHYYVKAVPKIKVSEEDFNRKEISTRRKSLIRRREKKE